jgi:hypothetical protein
MQGISPASAEKPAKQGFSVHFKRGAVTLHQEMRGIQSVAGAAKAPTKA